ncbi:MAG: acylphosphatase [Phycisphaerales bacterium]|nr:MAG: acylphosphatase [Phycisphaerales bacterium]
MHRRRAVYFGRVQGVGFRATTRDLANGFAIAGWVRNDPAPDFSVTLEAQGDEAEVSRFLARLNEVLARNISTQHHAPIPVVEGETGFVIRR